MSWATSCGFRNARVGKLVAWPLAFGLSWAALPLGALEVPFLAGRVNDLAGMLEERSQARLEQRLWELERQTGVQMAVLTIPSLEGENLEDFSHRVASTWKLGQKGQDNGVLFLIAKAERKMRLEVGYGLEATLPDVVCGRILDQVVRPRFRSGDFAGGIEAGVEAVAHVLQGKALELLQPASREEKRPPWPLLLLFMTIFLVVIGVFSLAALVGSGCQSWFLYLFLLPFWTAFPMVLDPLVGIGAGVAWLVLFPLAKLLLHKTALGKAFLANHPQLKSWALSQTRRGRRGGFWVGGLGGFSGGGFSGGLGGFSGGGFSGGGGSFGGGGASSSW